MDGIRKNEIICENKFRNLFNRMLIYYYIKIRFVYNKNKFKFTTYQMKISLHNDRYLCCMLYF
jgi:hypothetical protein